MANVTSNSLFIASALVFVLGLMFLAYPYLTSIIVVLCGVGHAYFSHSATFWRYYSYLSSVLWPPEGGNDAQVVYASGLLSGVDLPSPIPHVASGLETLKNRRSPVDEIISSTPRSTPTGSHGSASSVPAPLRSSPDAGGSGSHQLNFERMNSPKSSRIYCQEVHQNHVDVGASQKLRNRGGSGNTIQTSAGPLLSSGRYNPSYDSGVFVNVNSPGFTDRLVRCASDTGLNWGQTNLATQQERYNSVGLFPIVHLNTHTTPSLSAKTSQKAPRSNTGVRIAPPVYSEQRQSFNRGNILPMRPYVPIRETIRRKEAAKSVLESLQEASRKRIFSQCQEVLDDGCGKKRQRKGESALPNPNCDMYQYRHIRAPPVPSSYPMSGQNDFHPQNKRILDDPSSKANEPKRQRQHGKPHSVNNEITSSLSSSKTLLQRLSGNKRKADYECTEETNGKIFKESNDSVPPQSNSRWLHTRPCDEGESSARTQEVVRSQKKSPSEVPSCPTKLTEKKNSVTENIDKGNMVKNTACNQNLKANSKKELEKVEADLSSKLFRKEIVTRSQPKANLSEKKTSTWTQVPPDADERCLLEQSDSSELDRPERFQSLLSRMSGQDTPATKKPESSVLPTGMSDMPKRISTISSDPGKENSSKTQIIASSSSSILATSIDVLSTPISTATIQTVSSPELTSNSQTSASVIPLSSSTSTPFPPSFSTSTTSSHPPNPSVTPQTFASPPVQDQKTALLRKQDQTDGALQRATPSLPSTTPASSPEKPMFNFSPPSSATAPRPIAAKTVSVAGANISSSGSGTTHRYSPLFGQSTPQLIGTDLNFSSKSTEKSASATLPLPQPLLASVSTPSTGFTFLSVQPQSLPTSNSNISKIPAETNDSAIKFNSPTQNLQFSTSGASIISQPTSDSQLNGPTNASSLPPSNSSLMLASTNQSQASVTPTNSGEQKNAFGGFNFSGSSFGQTSTNNVGTESSFSFPVPSASATVSTSGNATLQSKSSNGSGSITFGTVTTAASQPAKPVAFAFSTPTLGSPLAVSSQKPPAQFGTGNSNINLTSSSFNNHPQGIFNGFNSLPNSSTSSSGTFGPSSSQSHQQNQGTGGFSFGSTSNQPSSPLTFGASAPATTSSVFGGRPSEAPSFGATTTTAFPLQSSVPSFSTASFGSPSSLSSIAFGSSQSTSSFGNQTSPSNPPTFGSASANPPSFNRSSNPSSGQTFGAMSPPTFGTNTTVPTGPTNNTFNFGTSKETSADQAFNFGSNTSGSGFTFNSNKQQQHNSDNPLFQFGQSSGSNPATFNFGSPNTQPGGSGGFSIGSGPSTSQRSTRTLQARRKRM